MDRGGEGTPGLMEPIEGTRQALEALQTEGVRVEADLRLMSEQARRIVPDLVGLSLADLVGGLSFTLVATDSAISTLDAMQYLDGGPCIEAVHEDHRTTTDNRDLLAEERWLLFARASAVAGVASTLTLPVLEDRRVVGSVNLYASRSDAFQGRHDELANALGASALGAVTNADLSFSTRLESQRAVAAIDEQDTLNIALGIIAARQQVDMATAEERLRDAAARAGASVIETARALRDAFDRGD